MSRNVPEMIADCWNFRISLERMPPDPLACCVPVIHAYTFDPKFWKSHFHPQLHFLYAVLIGDIAPNTDHSVLAISHLYILKHII